MLTSDVGRPLRQNTVMARWMVYPVKVLQRHIIDLCVNSVCVFNGSQWFLIDHPPRCKLAIYLFDFECLACTVYFHENVIIGEIADFPMTYMSQLKTMLL